MKLKERKERNEIKGKEKKEKSETKNISGKIK